MMFDKLLKSFSPFLIPVVTVVFTVIIWLTPEFIFEKKDSELIAAILIGIFAQVSQISITLSKQKFHTETTISSHIKKIVDLLKVHNDYFDNKWLFAVFTKIVKIVKMSETNPHDLHRVKDLIDNALTNSVKVIGEKYEIDIISGELERIVTLNEAVQRSQKYIYAVTVDKEGYFNNFWQDINKEYINFNIEAAKRGVRIERIFILPKEYFDSKTAQGKKFYRIIRKLKRAGRNMKIYSLDIQNDINAEHLFSFFICDDVMVSEASNDKDRNGYVVYNDKPLVEKLKVQFNGLKYKASQI